VPMEVVPVHLQPSGGDIVQPTHDLDALVQMNSQAMEALEQQMVTNGFAIAALDEETRTWQAMLAQQRELRRLHFAFLVVVVIALSMLLWQAVAYKDLLRDTTEGTESLRRMLEEYRLAQRAVDDMRFLEHVVRLPMAAPWCWGGDKGARRRKQRASPHLGADDPFLFVGYQNRETLDLCALVLVVSLPRRWQRPPMDDLPSKADRSRKFERSRRGYMLHRIKALRRRIHATEQRHDSEHPRVQRQLCDMRRALRLAESHLR